MLAYLILLQEGLLGDPEDLRARGVSWAITATGEVLSNVRGGLDERAEAEALLDLVLDVDLEQAAGWPGATARANPLWIEGRDPALDPTGDLTKVSNIDARDGARLFEAWLEQAVGRVSVRAGLLAADQEFVLSDHAALFVNGTFGLPVLLSLNAPVSAYPVGALGLRVRAEAGDGFYAMAALYEGSPDSEERNRTGLDIRLRDEEGLLWLAEGGWTHAAGAVKAGVYAHSGEFPDHSSGELRRGTHGVYGVVDQALADGLAAFVRCGAAPERNAFVSRYVEAGVVLTGWLPGRPGLAWARAVLSDEIRGGRYETVVELTWRIDVLPGWTVQPDFQYVRHPGGFGAIDDATVVGLRVEVLF